MAFKVITDSGLDDSDAVVTDANAYVSLEDFLAYWLDRGTDYSDYEPEAILANIIKATDYMERRFGRAFLGRKVYPTQALSFPRAKLYLRDGSLVEGVPLKVRQACAEYAARSLLGKVLWADPTVNRNIKKKVTGVGPIREEVEYLDGGLSDEVFPSADALLAEYLMKHGSNTR